MSDTTARQQWLAALGLATAGALFLVAALLVFQGSLGSGYDFETYLLAAQRLADGEGLYVPLTLEGPFRPGPYGLYLYAPPLALAIVPLTALPTDVATAVWLVLRVALLAVSCALMPVSRPVRLAAFGVAALSRPVLYDLNLGNVSIVVTFLLVLVWRWLDRPMGAVALALTMSLRPTTGLVLIWSLVRRRWAFAAWTVLAGLALIAITLPFVGIEAYLDYLRVLGYVSDATGVENNRDLGSTALELGLGATVASGALYAGYGIAVLATLLSLRRDRELSFVVSLGASLLLAPLLWDHYLCLLLIPAAFLASRGRTWGLALPLLAWAPAVAAPLIVLAGLLLPFLAHPPARPPSAVGGQGRAA